MLEYYKFMDVFENEPMPEYRLIYHWDAEHWTCITSGDIPPDIDTYINNNLAEMQEAMEVSEDAYFSIEYYYGSTLVHKWAGTPEDIREVITKITNSWLDRAFQ